MQYSVLNSIENASEIGKSIYMNQYIDNFLNDEYENPLDYYNCYLDFFKDTRITSYNVCYTKLLRVGFVYGRFYGILLSENIKTI